jgi:hypothetical protein
MNLQRSIYSGIAGFVASFVASHAVALAWRIATRQKPPKDADQDLGVATSSAVIFAGLVGAATAIAQTLAARHALRALTDRGDPEAEG